MHIVVLVLGFCEVKGPYKADPKAQTSRTQNAYILSVKENVGYYSSCAVLVRTLPYVTLRNVCMRLFVWCAFVIM